MAHRSSAAPPGRTLCLDPPIPAVSRYPTARSRRGRLRSATRLTARPTGQGRTPPGGRHDDWGWQEHQPWLEPRDTLDQAIAVLEVVPYLDDIAPGVLDVDRERSPPATRRGWSATRQLRPGARGCTRGVRAPPRTRSARGGLPRCRTPWPGHPQAQPSTAPQASHTRSSSREIPRAQSSAWPRIRSLFRQLTRAYVINRLARSGRRRAAQRSWGYGRGSEAKGPCSDGGPNVCLRAERPGDT